MRHDHDQAAHHRSGQGLATVEEREQYQPIRGVIMERIRDLAIEFQNAIYRAKADNRFKNDQMFRCFPRRCCGVASELLARYLLNNFPENSIRVKYKSGTFYEEDQNHAWLEINGCCVADITINQFENRQPPLYFCEKLYVGPYINYFDLFEINYEEQCNNHYPLDDTPVRGYLTRKQLYDIICEYLT